MSTKTFLNTDLPDPEITPLQTPEENPTPVIPMEDPTPARTPDFPEPNQFPDENPLPTIQPEFPGTPSGSPEIQRF